MSKAQRIKGIKEAIDPKLFKPGNPKLFKPGNPKLFKPGNPKLFKPRKLT